MKKHILPLALCLIVAAGAVVFALFARAVLSGDWPRVQAVHVETVAAVELDDAWADGLAGCSTVAQMKAQISETLAQVQAFGGNAVALTGRTSALAGGDALFRDKTGALATVAAITQSDRFFARFDALRWLVQQAAEQNMEVLLLATDDSCTPLPTSLLESSQPACLTALAERYGLRVLAEYDESESILYTGYGTADASLSIGRCDGNSAALAAAVQEGQFTNVFLGAYTALCQDDSPAVIYAAYTRTARADLTACKAGKTVAETLAVTYPTENGATVTTSSLFLMGTSDPASPLTLDGAEVPRYGTRGVWGVLVELTPGENTFAFENGGQSLAFTVQFQKSTATGGKTTPTSDGSVAAGEGQFLRITDAIASTLGSPWDSSSIHETLYQGALVQVAASRQYQSGSKLTYAYQLATGDYIRSTACQLVEAENAAFNGLQFAASSETNCTVLAFSGSGTPAVYHTWEGNTLTLTFYSATYTGEAPVPDGAFVQSCTVENGADCFTLTLTFADGDSLYGWAVNYDTSTNSTTVWLKHTPRLSENAAAPLSGVTVLLDAGHGGDADGAMGSAGIAAPQEKELNLSVAQAAKFRLEQLGATVWMTRDGDTNPSLGDRVTAMNEQHPDYFISIHHNSLELNNDVNLSSGTEAYWFYDTGAPLAQNLVDGVCAVTGRQARGVKYGYYYVTRSNICPATLLELGFVTNPAEYEDCETDSTLWLEGGAIAQAIYETVKANG